MSEKAQHTKGPWRVVNFSDLPCPTVIQALGGAKNHSGKGIIKADGWCGMIDRPEEVKANAYLVATAPELLHIAKELDRWERNPDRFRGDLADLAIEARATIAKALGQTFQLSEEKLLAREAAICAEEME